MVCFTQRKGFMILNGFIYGLIKKYHEVVYFLYLYIYMCILHDDLMRGHIDLVILRSTTGPYGRPRLDVAYGEMLCSLHRGCMGVDSSRRVVRVST